TAIEEGTFTVLAKDRPPQASRYSTLYVRQDGQWLIAALKEWGDDTTTRPTLQNLAWLIGTWESDGPDLQARTNYEWAENKKFIVGKFTITQKKDKSKVSTGTQIIGIDPAFAQIRAWVFDSEGGIGESTWNWDGERWEIESHANLATGQGTSAVIFLKRVDDDAFTLQSVQRTLAGESQPDVGIVKVQRVPGGK
ncbi:MAG TPA: hypothetical protein VE988_04075, partial [Gemmataceae bacterium]|nr:hypothetical protein [Gemmataceae bacterium]